MRVGSSGRTLAQKVMKGGGRGLATRMSGVRVRFRVRVRDHEG